MTILETPRLVLRRFVPEDVAAFHHIVSDRVTMSFWPAPFTREQAALWIERSIASYEKNGFGRYAVLLKETGELIGDCGIARSMVNGVEENDLGYIFHKDHWKQGYAIEAASAVKDYALDTLKITRLCANMAHDHTASRHVAERIGMKLEREFINKRNRGILTRLYVANG